MSVLPFEPEPTPTLNPEIVEDEELLDDAVERFVAANAIARQEVSRIAEHVEFLRQTLEPPTWALLLDIRRDVCAREAGLRIALIRWAFAEGRRHPVSAPVESAS